MIWQNGFQKILTVINRTNAVEVIIQAVSPEEIWGQLESAPDINSLKLAKTAAPRLIGGGSRMKWKLGECSDISISSIV